MDESSNIPIAIDSSIPRQSSFSTSRSSSRRSRVTLPIDTSEPRPTRRDRQLPSIPKSPWPAASNTNMDNTDDESSPGRGGERYYTPRLAPPPPPPPPPQPLGTQWDPQRPETNQAQAPRVAHSTPSLRSPPSSQSMRQGRPSYSPPSRQATGDRDLARAPPRRTGSSIDFSRPNPPSRSTTSTASIDMSRPSRAGTRTDSDLSITTSRNKKTDQPYQPRKQSSQSPPAPLMPTNATQTKYMEMLLSLDKIPQLHNILCSCFTWLLLAGFVVIPGSFTSLRKLEAKTNGEIIPGSPAANAILSSVAETSVTVIGFICMGIGTTGAIWLGWRWRKNYVWLLNKLYMPLMLNGLAGVISTLTNVYSQQKGEWRTQAIVAVTVEGSVLSCAVILFGLYNFWLLDRVKDEHEELTLRSTSTGTLIDDGGQGNRKSSILQRVGEMGRRPAIAPGSVV
ncbi:hypothetical protein V8F06_011947 [Rhypophila decipiens]